MYSALQSVRYGTAIAYAAKQLGIPRTTLTKKLIDYDSDIDRVQNDEGIRRDISYKQRTGGFHAVLTADQEAALFDYIINMEKNLKELTVTDVRRLAYQLAGKLEVPHTFNHTKGVAGEDWFTSVKKRHDLPLYKSKPTSKARANGFTQAEVNEFFNIYEESLEREQIKEETIHNVDESPVTVNPKKAPIIL